MELTNKILEWNLRQRRFKHFLDVHRGQIFRGGWAKKISYTLFGSFLWPLYLAYLLGLAFIGLMQVQMVVI